MTNKPTMTIEAEAEKLASAINTDAHRDKKMKILCRALNEAYKRGRRDMGEEAKLTALDYCQTTSDTAERIANGICALIEMEPS